MQSELNIQELKSILQKRLEEQEGLVEKNQSLEKVISKLKSDFKETRMYNEHLEAELQVTKDLAKERA